MQSFAELDHLRPSQRRILEYRSGRMAVSAVPGSGKTYILSMLAAELVLQGKVNVAKGQEVLVVTFLNSSVDTFSHRIAQWLQQADLPLEGYDVRTLHSLAREIIQCAPADAGIAIEAQVFDEIQSREFLERAVRSWLSDQKDKSHILNRSTGADVEKNYIERSLLFVGFAKNNRFTPDLIKNNINDRSVILQFMHQAAELGFDVKESLQSIGELTQIYHRYQDILAQQGGLDFNDLIMEAVRLIETVPTLVDTLSDRWPYILEDEAQDSVPLQQQLLDLLSAPNGNWVRVGDPNQAVTSSFTASHPLFFRRFLVNEDVLDCPLTSSGRSSRRIINTANHLLEWSCHRHPEIAVRDLAFLEQYIQPTSKGDQQPNPSDQDSLIRTRTFESQEKEFATITGALHQLLLQHPQDTFAVLVFTNRDGVTLGGHLENTNLPYDLLVKGSDRSEQVTGAINEVLQFLSNPTSSSLLSNAYDAAISSEHLSLASDETDIVKCGRLVGSVRPDSFLFPLDGNKWQDSLPQNIPISEPMLDHLNEFRRTAIYWLGLLRLPVEESILVLAEQLFDSEQDVSIAFRVSSYVRRLSDAHPDWRLPDFVQQLAQIATGQQVPRDLYNFDSVVTPTPGRVTITTMHKAKGMEWDTVFLATVTPRVFRTRIKEDSSFRFGSGLEMQSSLETAASILLTDSHNIPPGKGAFEHYQAEEIAEKLRLLYVGITRAKKHLFLSRAQKVSNRDVSGVEFTTTPWKLISDYVRDHKLTDYAG